MNYLKSIIPAMLISVIAAACVKSNTNTEPQPSAKTNSKLIIGQWSLKKQTIKGNSPAIDTTITSYNIESRVYEKDGSLLYKNEYGETFKLSYYINKDTLVHLHSLSSQTGYPAGTVARENLMIKKLDDHNLIVTYTTQGVAVNSPNYFFSELTFAR